MTFPRAAASAARYDMGRSRFSITKDRDAKQQRRGFTAFTRCACGNERDDWEYDTDSMTGSSYAICRACGKRYQFRGAWRDNALGMNFGSWWSQHTGDGFVVEAGDG